MRRWSDAAGAVGATGRTSEKIAVLASYLRSLDPVDLPVAVTFLAGRPFPQGDERAPGLGWVAIATAAERVAHSGPGALARHYEASSDLGRAVEDLLAEAASEGQRAGIPALPELSLPEVLATFEAIAAAPAAQRAALLEALLRRADPTTAKFLVKVMGGDMRIGLRDGHLEAAIAAAFDRPAAAVQWAGMLTGDLGETALMARDNRLEAAELAM
ncbi:MAG TPA: hypothetical protein VFW86_04820, partial [Candidatus Limnocylindrales bacterium]|nr:hypothetical protein [Candidatus Limnocylindrales bacterium]